MVRLPAAGKEAIADGGRVEASFVLLPNPRGHRFGAGRFSVNWRSGVRQVNSHANAA